MRLADLRTCDGCGGLLFQPRSRWFQLIRTSGVLITQQAAEVLSAAARHGVPLSRLPVEQEGLSVCVVGEQQPACMDELLLCVSCYHDRPIAEIVRRRREHLAMVQQTQGKAS